MEGMVQRNLEMKASSFLICLGLAALAVSPASMFSTRAEPNSTDRVNFSHAFHLNDLGMECEFCHFETVDSSGSKETLLPLKDNCAACHDVKSSEQCSLCHKDPANVQPASTRERQLRFSHTTHQTLTDLPGKIRSALSEGTYPQTYNLPNVEQIQPGLVCTGCHRGMDEVGTNASSRYPLMADCLVCHTSEGDAMDRCEDCHIETRDLLPADHRNQAFFDDHSSSDANLELLRCRQCHTPDFIPCTQCH